MPLSQLKYDKFTYADYLTWDDQERWEIIDEILSLSTFYRDINLKFRLYQKYKVQEYQIVDPDNNTLKVYQLDEQGVYQLAKEYGEKGKVKVGIFTDLEIDLSFVFEE